MTRTRAAATALLLLLAACTDTPRTPLAPGEAIRDLGGNSPHGGGPPRGLLFRSLRADPGPGLYTMNANGSEPTRIPGTTAADLFPDWSPNGKRISFVSNRVIGNAEVWVMNADGSEPVRLTDSPGVDGAARWSPDGRRIAFHSQRDGNFEIYVMNADGTDPRRVTHYALQDMTQSWSPDGRRIVFHRNLGDRFEVHSIDADASEGEGAVPTRLTFDGGESAVFSPEGGRIAFATNRDGYWAIYLINADGSGPANLTPKPEDVPVGQWFSQFPRWSRNGREIYFHGIRPNSAPDLEIFVLDVEGGGVTRLTASAGADVTPVPR